ncbi:MAG: hypothetical protein ABIH92_00485, partial [Nanoarchaeota archaeon]
MKKLVIILLIVYIFLNVVSIALFAKTQPVFFDPGTDQGIITLAILEGEPQIIIHHPENITYNFDYSNISIYGLDLNVSSNFGADEWQYELHDLEHDTLYAP